MKCVEKKVLVSCLSILKLYSFNSLLNNLNNKTTNEQQ